MDQAKIGSFIQISRKQANLTQKELAEKLGVSNKLVSKWETGGGIPDIALWDSLCNVLNVTVNELIAGERIPIEKYSKKADENVMELLKTNRTQRFVHVVQIVLGLTIVIIAVMMLIVTNFGIQTPFIEAYLDLPSFLIVSGLAFASVLLSGANTVKKAVTAVRSVVIPTGILVVVFEIIGLLNQMPQYEALLIGLGVAFIPLFYSAVIWIIAIIIDNRLLKNK